MGIIVKGKIWLWIAAVFFYGSVLLYLILWPLILLYSCILCVIGWCLLPSNGKDVLLVYNGTDEPERRSELETMVSNRAMLLDFAQRRSWDTWSLPSQLYYQFGPRSIPDRFSSGLLPAVIVFKRFRWPKRFSFGKRIKNQVEKMCALRSELTGES